MLRKRGILLILCALFYAVLCIFSIVTGIIYAGGKRELNPLELSDSFMEKLSDPGRRSAFAKKMGYVTIIVGIVQGITSYCLFAGKSPQAWWIALGFTIFSIGSVSVKLKGKINAFPLLKAAAYITILVILLLSSTRMIYFGA